MHLGTAFQLVDDILDYSGNADAIGKNLGDDLAEGKMTLPLIRALATGSPEDAAVIRHAVTGGGLTDFAPVAGGARAHRRARPTRRHARTRKSAWPPCAWQVFPILRTGKVC